MLSSALFIICAFSVTDVFGHARNDDFIAMFDAYLPSGDKCGQQKPITGWIETRDICEVNNAPSQLNAVCPTTGNFANGIFTTPALGVYHCCASFRCKQGGYCDFTVIRNGGTVYAAFGTRNTGISANGWSSHSTCWTNRAGQGVTWWLNLESTAGSDCIEETGWRYSRFSCFFVSPST